MTDRSGFKVIFNIRKFSKSFSDKKPVVSLHCKHGFFIQYLKIKIKEYKQKIYDNKKYRAKTCLPLFLKKKKLTIRNEYNLPDFGQFGESKFWLALQVKIS